MRAAVLLALVSLLAADGAEARRRTVIYKIKRAPPAAVAVPHSATQQVRIIPLRRWNLWCARIGGLDCP